MSFCFRRLYATLPKPPPPSALEARATSAPLQVRRRRLRKQLAGVSEASATPSPLSPSEKERYTRLKRLGALPKQGNGSRESTEAEWLARLNEKRVRIRGARRRVVKNPDTGESTVVEDVVGQRIYLPNIIFRMTRNFTPPGEPYNPWEATFRVPTSLTKLDIRSYLFAVYGLKCTYIRTDNYFEPLKNFKRKHIRRQLRRAAYKRAVVGLLEPFYYPEALEDMDLKERQTREEWLNNKFQIEAYNVMRDTEMRRQWYNSTSWKPGNLVGPRGAILKAVMARQQAREQAAMEGAQALLEKSSQHAAAEEGTPVTCSLEAELTYQATVAST
jgi:large subunit ribosomal protein L23